VAVEPGLGDEQAGRAAGQGADTFGHLGQALDLLADLVEVGGVAVARGRLADAGRRAELAEGLA